jgi:hypothetical protein
VLVNLAVRRASTDAELVVGLNDAVETPDVAQVNEESGLGQAELEERYQAIAAGEELGLALALREDLEGLIEIGGTHIVKLSRDHRAIVLLTQLP